MCMMMSAVARRPGAPSGWGEMESLPGYELHVAEEGQELTNQQKQDNWAYGGQSWEQAYGKNLHEHRFSGQANAPGVGSIGGAMANMIMGHDRMRLRTKRGQLRPPMRSSPAPTPLSEPGQDEVLQGESTQDNTRKEKYKKQAGQVSSTKKGTKKLKAISDTSMPTMASDKTGLNI